MGKPAVKLFSRLRDYGEMIKSPQTILLVFTGIAGFASAACPVLCWRTVIALTGSLFLAVSGSTVLNMVCDADIDGDMLRTCRRPLPTGRISHGEGLFLGLTLSILGVGWSLLLSPLYGLVVFAGLACDVFLYTLWLKRRTAWSIVWGGIAGGMPILAGRVLAVGSVDALGILLALTILFWIPTHIMTFSIKYADEYRAVGVPVFPNRYGVRFTQSFITVSTATAVVVMVAAGLLLGRSWNHLGVVAVLGAGLVALSVFNLVKPTSQVNSLLYKFASLYMLGAMAVLAFGG